MKRRGAIRRSENLNKRRKGLGKVRRKKRVSPRKGRAAGRVRIKGKKKKGKSERWGISFGGGGGGSWGGCVGVVGGGGGGFSDFRAHPPGCLSGGNVSPILGTDE